MLILNIPCFGLCLSTEITSIKAAKKEETQSFQKPKQVLSLYFVHRMEKERKNSKILQYTRYDRDVPKAKHHI